MRRLELTTIKRIKISIIISIFSEFNLNIIATNDVIIFGGSAPLRWRVHLCSATLLSNIILHSLFLIIDIRYSLCSDVGEFVLFHLIYLIQSEI